MKLLVLSDSHGYKRTLFDLILDHSDCDVIVFLGDGEKEFKESITSCHLIPNKIVCQVRGNEDHSSHEPGMMVREFGGVRFLITHGHDLNVQYGLRWIAAEAKKQGCTAVLFGHTQRRLFEMKDGVTLINPGSSGKGSCCVVQVEDGVIDLLDG